MEGKRIAVRCMTAPSRGMRIRSHSPIHPDRKEGKDGNHCKINNSGNGYNNSNYNNLEGMQNYSNVENGKEMSFDGYRQNLGSVDLGSHEIPDLGPSNFASTAIRDL